MDKEIIGKLDEILEFLKNRKPEVDEKLEHVKTACVIDKNGGCKCGCGCCTDEKCECEGCEHEK